MPGRVIAACDEKLARYRAIAEAGGDPATVAGWIAEVNAQRAATVARRQARKVEPSKIVRLAEADIERLIGSFDHVRNTIRRADPASRGQVYRQLRLRLTYHPGDSKIRAEALPDPDSRGFWYASEGGCEHPYVAPMLENGAGVAHDTTPVRTGHNLGT